MIILALDTSTESCSAALQVGDKIYSRFVGALAAGSKNTDFILPIISELLNEAGIQKTQIELIAFARGPGSFTGVRVATALSQALATALHLAVAPISTLKMLGEAARVELNLADDAIIYVANDARMQEIYAAAYRVVAGGLEILEPEYLCAPQLLKTANIGSAPVILVGSAWQRYYGADLPLPIAGEFVPISCDARYLLALAEAMFSDYECVRAEAALPVYLRNNVALKKAERSL